MYEITDDGLLYTSSNGHLYIPDCKVTQELLLQEHHDRKNHFSRYKTQEKLARWYFLPTMTVDTDAYIRSCSQCLRNKSSTQSPAGLLHPLLIPLARWISLDHCLSLKDSIPCSSLQTG